MKRDAPLVEGEFYHIFNRGVEKRQIFMDEHDCARFKVLLYLCNSTSEIDIDDHFQKGRTFLDLWRSTRGKQLVDIGAWCLMPNHFHLILRQKGDGGISNFMKKLGVSYSMYFNKRQDRVGSLMQGRFQSRHIDGDIYLQWLFSYVHLNPASLKYGESKWKNEGVADFQELQKFLDSYPHSSLVDYKKSNSKRIESRIITPELFPWMYSSSEEMYETVQEQLQMAQNSKKSPFFE